MSAKGDLDKVKTIIRRHPEQVRLIAIAIICGDNRVSNYITICSALLRFGDIRTHTAVNVLRLLLRVIIEMDSKDVNPSSSNTVVKTTCNLHKIKYCNNIVETKVGSIE